MIRGPRLLALALGLGLAAAACSSTGEGVPSPSPLDGVEPNVEVADEVRILADRSRSAVTRATSGVRSELSALRAADVSLEATAVELRARLTEMREKAIDEGVDSSEAQVESFLERLGRLQERAATIEAAINDVHARLENFEDWADEVVRQAVTDDVSQDFHRQQLLDVETEADELTRNIVLAPRTRASDRLVTDMGLLGSDIERARVGLDTEIDTRQRKARTLQKQRDAQVATIDVPESLPPESTPVVANEVVEIRTNLGLLVLELFPDVAPHHVENFRKLVGEGFYDGLTIHRVVPGYLVQGGCPLGTGAGGPGYQINAEFNDRPHLRGTLSMARFAHPDSAGSQFFICLTELPELDGKYTVFGRLLAGEETLAAIEALGTEAGGAPTETIELQRVALRERRPDEVRGLAHARAGG